MKILSSSQLGRGTAGLMLSMLIVVSVAYGAEPPKIPSHGFGPAMGWKTGDLAGFDVSGPSLELRYMKVFPSYPILALGVEGDYSRLDVEAAGLRGADAYGYGVVAATMVPFDLFGIGPADLPRGAGLPLYVGYNPLERIDFIDAGAATLSGQSLRFGLQLPTPWAILQLEYTTFFFGDDQRLPAALGGGEADFNTFQIGLQFPIPLGFHH